MSSPAGSILHHLRRLAPPASDAALLTRWRDQRDEAAFAALVTRHGPMVLGVCRRVLGDVQHAEDTFQATFLVLARKANRVRRPEALASFLYGVALRVARKARGTAAHRLRFRAKPQATSEPVDPHLDPLDVLSGRELLALIDQEVARLPEVYRLPLLLCLLQGRTVEEAARLLGWSIGSLRGRLARGRERLRERLTRRGVGLSAGTLVLLAPAVVSERLLADCVRNLAVPASAAVNALARSVPVLKMKMVCLGLLVVAAVGLGTGLPLLRAPQMETPNAVTPAAPSQAKNEPRRDRYGDPLPPGASARLGTLRFRAPGEVAALAFAPDGKTIAVSSRGGLFLMDAASGKRLRRLPSATPDWLPEAPIVFSADGKRLIGRGHKIAGSSALPVVRVWELVGEREPREYDIGLWVLWVGWSVEGQPLAIRAEEGTLHLHDLAAGRSRRFACKEPRKYPSGFISRDPPVACSPVAKALAVVDDKNVVHVWDTTTGRERCTFQPKGESFYSLTFSPNGRRLLTISPKAVQMWDVATAKALYTTNTTRTFGHAVFSSDGNTLAIGNAWDRIEFWDGVTGQERGHTQDKDAFSEAIALSADGKRLVTSTRYGSALHLWDVASGKRKAEPIGHTNRPSGTFSPDGRRVATRGSMDGTFRIWDARSGEQLIQLSSRGAAGDCAFSPDGRSLFASGSSGSPTVYDAATGKRQHVLPLDDPDRPDTVQSVSSMHLSDDGKSLVAFSYYYPKKDGAGPRYGDTLITGWDT
ncbi:MAG TPA: sigma-70 family RNA polymerase sigma factor, partial [Gemmataceae bacterium]|nr:sigma-70 family RNA polymerase sigma factor [Gemmataceae bacterium]